MVCIRHAGIEWGHSRILYSINESDCSAFRVFIGDLTGCLLTIGQTWLLVTLHFF